MERIKLVQQIQARMGRLVDYIEEQRLSGRDVTELENEMTALREKLKEVMNSNCPVIKDRT